MEWQNWDAALASNRPDCVSAARALEKLAKISAKSWRRLSG